MRSIDGLSVNPSSVRPPRRSTPSRASSTASSTLSPSISSPPFLIVSTASSTSSPACSSGPFFSQAARPSSAARAGRPSSLDTDSLSSTDARDGCVESRCAIARVSFVRETSTRLHRSSATARDCAAVGASKMQRCADAVREPQHNSRVAAFAGRATGWRSTRYGCDGGFSMLSWALTFFVVAIIAAVLGFTQHCRRSGGHREDPVLHLPGADAGRAGGRRDARQTTSLEPAA